MNLYYDHVSKIDLFKNDEDFYTEKVIVSYILPNSHFNILNNVSIGSSIIEFNDKKVNNLSDIRKIIKKPYKINNVNILKIKDNNNNIIFLNFDEIIKKNKLLSKLYKFNIKNIIH